MSKTLKTLAITHSLTIIFEVVVETENDVNGLSKRNDTRPPELRHCFIYN